MDKKLLSRFPVFFVAMVFLFFGCGGGKKEAELETQPVEPVTAVSEPEAETAKPLPAASSAEMDFEVDELDDEEVVLNGSLNWSKGFVRAKGYGLPPDNIRNPQQAKLLAFRAAYADALASLLEITKGVRVTATTTVQDYMVKDNTVELKVDGIVKGAKEIRREYLEKDRTAVVEVGVALEDVAMAIPKEFFSSGGASNLELWESERDATLRQIAGDNEDLMNSIITSLTLDEIEDKLRDMSEENERSADRDEKLIASIMKLTEEIERLKVKEVPVRYTGIVVNAAGSGIKPCMAPSIYYKAGDEYKLLYGINDGRARDENLHALVLWERTMTEATQNPRVIETPIVVNATHLAKEQSALAIDANDAKKLEDLNEETHFLDNGKVVVVR